MIPKINHFHHSISIFKIDGPHFLMNVDFFRFNTILDINFIYLTNS